MMKKILTVFVCVVVFVCVDVPPLSAEEAFTIDRCVELATEHSYSLRVIDAQGEIARDTKAQAIAEFFPHASAVATYQYIDKNIQLLDYSRLDISALIPSYMRNLTEVDLHGVALGGVTIVQPIFLGGKLIVATQMADLAGDLVAEQKRNEQEQLSLLVQQNYWAIVALSQKKKMTEQLLIYVEQNRTTVRYLIDEGLLTPSDSLLLAVRADEVALADSKISDAVELARLNLKQLCGIEPDASFVLADEQTDDIVTELTNLAYSDDDVYAHRGEIRGLELARRMDKKETAMAVAGSLPNVVVNANYLMANRNWEHGIKEGFGGTYNVGVTMQVPITGWIGGGYRIHSKQVSERIREYEIEMAKEKVSLDVQQAVLRYQQAVKALDMAVTAKEHADINMNKMNLSFSEGLISPTLLLAAETSWLQASIELVDAQIALKHAELEFHRAVGRVVEN